MAGVGLTPSRSTVAEKIRDLQRWARHANRTSGGWLGLLELAHDVIAQAHDLAYRLGGEAGVERRGIELGVAEQHLDHYDIDVLFQKMGGKVVPEWCGDTRLSIPAMWAAAWQARLNWRVVRGLTGIGAGGSGRIVAGFDISTTGLRPGSPKNASSRNGQQHYAALTLSSSTGPAMIGRGCVPRSWKWDAAVRSIARLRSSGRL